MLQAAIPLLGKFAINAAVNAAQELPKMAFANDQANKQKKYARRVDELKYQRNRDDYYAAFNQAFQETDLYNQSIVATHNRQVEEYELREDQLDREEVMAYNNAQLQANSVLEGFFESNLDLLQNYVVSSGTLAARGINSASALLTTMKNMDNGFLQSVGRLQRNAANQLGGIIRTIDKIEYLGETQREAWYHAVKDKPSLKPYPQMQHITPYKTPAHLKTKRMSFNDAVPGLIDTAISTFGGAAIKHLGKAFAGNKATDALKSNFGGNLSQVTGGSSGFGTDLGDLTEEFSL